MGSSKFCRLETYTIVKVLCKEKKSYKITDIHVYTNECLFRMKRKSRNYNCRKAVKYHRRLKKKFFLKTWHFLTFVYFLAADSLIKSSHENLSEIFCRAKRMIVGFFLELAPRFVSCLLVSQLWLFVSWCWTSLHCGWKKRSWRPFMYQDSSQTLTRKWLQTTNSISRNLNLNSSFCSILKMSTATPKLPDARWSELTEGGLCLHQT